MKMIEEEEESFLERKGCFGAYSGEKLWCGSFVGNSWERVGIAGIVFESGAMVHPGQDPDSKLK